MADHDDAQALWLPVIGKALAYLCLQDAVKRDPDKFDSVLKRVEFLENLGLRQDDAAEAAGSSAGSVRELRRLKKSGGKVSNGKKKKS